MTVPVDGVPVAEISPVRPERRQPLPRADLADLLHQRQARPGLSEGRLLAG